MAAAPEPIAFGDFAPNEGSTAPKAEEPGAEVEEPGAEVEEPGAEVEEPGAAASLTVHTGSLRGAITPRERR